MRGTFPLCRNILEFFVAFSVFLRHYYRSLMTSELEIRDPIHGFIFREPTNEESSTLLSFKG